MAGGPWFTMKYIGCGIWDTHFFPPSFKVTANDTLLTDNRLAEVAPRPLLMCCHTEITSDCLAIDPSSLYRCNTQIIPNCSKSTSVQFALLTTRWQSQYICRWAKGERGSLNKKAFLLLLAKRWQRLQRLLEPPEAEERLDGTLMCLPCYFLLLYFGSIMCWPVIYGFCLPVLKLHQGVAPLCVKACTLLRVTNANVVCLPALSLQEHGVSEDLANFPPCTGWARK